MIDSRSLNTSGLYDYHSMRVKRMTTEIFMATVAVFVAMGWRSTALERSKFLKQRDALLEKLDAEGRGMEALEAIKHYR
ncbi:hypothetical protein bas65_0009 [Escherichia phage JacobBurckhardt]|uniref:Uncharacterized protein n=1 Tax=Escherichia phage JacobBurckhardt TaxID=2852037 RepID=A0AAE7VTM2_9CAUD|nr:hypothetical protein bas65_0009 [Escherichia phage JacobBurckhardt]